MKYAIYFAVLSCFMVVCAVSFTHTARLNLHTFEMFKNYLQKTDASIFFLYYPLPIYAWFLNFLSSGEGLDCFFAA